jgi:death-on-curing protein
VLAAAYAFGLAKNHGYIDGNKRVAFMAAYVFLGLNGHDLDADEPDVARTMDRVADGRLSEAGLATWLRPAIRPLRK